MENLYFEDYEDFARDICEEYEKIKNNDDYNDVSVIAKHEEVRQLIKWIMIVSEYDLNSIVLKDVEYNGYEDEYVLTLYEDEIWCEPFKRDGKYFTDESGVTYILDNCSSKVIKYCKGDVVYEVCLEDYEEDDESECDCCNCVCKETEQRPVRNTVESSYTVNGKSVSKEEFDKALADFNKKYDELDEMYLDNIRDMLLRYREFTDEIDEWRKLLCW